MRVYVDTEKFTGRSEMIAALKEAGHQVNDNIMEADLVHKFNVWIINANSFEFINKSREFKNKKLFTKNKKRKS